MIALRVRSVLSATTPPIAAARSLMGSPPTPREHSAAREGPRGDESTPYQRARRHSPWSSTSRTRRTRRSNSRWALASMRLGRDSTTPRRFQHGTHETSRCTVWRLVNSSRASPICQTCSRWKSVATRRRC